MVQDWEEGASFLGLKQRTDIILSLEFHKAISLPG